MFYLPLSFAELVPLRYGLKVGLSITKLGNLFCELDLVIHLVENHANRYTGEWVVWTVLA